jgi:hypothetical protein
VAWMNFGSILGSAWRISSPMPTNHVAEMRICFLNVPWWFPECSLMVPWVHPQKRKYSLNVPWKFPGGTLSTSTEA